jgi:hypothetical protein
MREFLMRLLLCLATALFVSCGSSSDRDSDLLSRGADNNVKQRFPLGPVVEVTPGSTCQHPDEIRYPSRVPYCSRNVSTNLKNDIIAQYDRDFGFEIREMSRQEFKIDHYIPLSIGGSNDRTNLWPQHRSVYELTDPLESMVSELIIHDRITQKEAIQQIQFAKNNLDQVSAVHARLEGMMD